MKPLSPKNINQQLNRYFNGDMTGAEMHTLEKTALSDPFLRDAMDGYAAHPEGLNYFNESISKKLKITNRYWGMGVLGIALLVMTGLYFTKEPATDNQQSALNKVVLYSDSKTIDHQSEPEIEVLPEAIEIMTPIKAQEQIKTENVSTDFTNNKTYYTEAENDLDSIVLIDPSSLLIDEETPAIIVAKKEAKRVIYPYRYFYDMAVVDYSIFEGREKKIDKTVYRLSGLDASYESDSNKNSPSLVAETRQVRYLDYLEETMFYFSKDRYKNALKRLNIISEQYKYDLNVLFYGGLCYFNLGDFTIALEEFNTILKLKEGPFTEEAEWYKAKTLLKLKRKADAKNLLADIILRNGFYKNQASELIVEIK